MISSCWRARSSSETVRSSHRVLSLASCSCWARPSLDTAFRASMTRRVRTHPVKSRRPLTFGYPQYDFAASVAGVEPLVRTAYLAQVQHLLPQRANQAPFDQARQLVESRPLACEEHAVERLVLPVEKREVSLRPQDRREAARRVSSPGCSSPPSHR